MSREPPRVVFDCVIYAQALINPKGPAGTCLKAAECGDCRLYFSPFVLNEIRALPEKLPPRYGITAEQIETLIGQLFEYAVQITEVHDTYTHPIDRKDSAYINLALATGASLVVSRDRHLLLLMDSGTAEGHAFKNSFPGLRIVGPVEFMRELEPNRGLDQP